MFVFCVFQFLKFIEQLSGVLGGVDCVSADVGLDGAVDTIMVRAEQLVKNDSAAATEMKSQMYALKRKLKTMKEQLDGKVRTTGLPILSGYSIRGIQNQIRNETGFRFSGMHLPTGTAHTHSFYCSSGICPGPPG